MKNKLFFRILLYFLSLLLPIIIIGTIYYVNYTNSLQKEFSDKIQLNLQSSVAAIDLVLQTAQETSMSFFFDDNVVTILRPYEQYSLHEKVRLPQISRALSRIRSITSDFVDRIYVFADDRKVYSSDGMEDYDTFFTQFYSYEKYDPAFWSKKLQSGFLLEILEPSVVHTQDLKPKRVLPIMIRSMTNGKNAVLVTNIPVDLISKTLKNNSIFQSTGFIVLDNENRMVLSGFQDNAGSLAEQLNQAFRDKDIKQAEIHINGKNCIVNLMKSENYGWTYYSVTPKQEFRDQAQGLIHLLILICLVLAFVGVICAFIFTLNLYNPIRKIRDILVTKEDILDFVDHQHRKNEFEFIGMGINQLLADHQKLKMLSFEYLESSLNNLIRGNRVPNEQNLEKVLAEKLHFNKNGYMCCNIQFDFTDAFYSEIPEVERLINLHKLKKLIWGVLSHYVKTFVLEYEQHFFVCIVNADAHDHAELHKALNLLTEVFKHDLHYCEMTIGIGNPYPGLDGIAKSYGDGLTAIQNRNPKMNVQVIDSANLSIKQRLFYSLADENKVMNGIKLGDHEQLTRLMESIIQDNREKGVSFHYMNMLLSEMVHTGQKWVAERGGDASAILTDSENIILDAKTDFPSVFREKKRLLFHVYEQLLERSAKPKEQRPDFILSEIKAYIEKNYHEDLYLEKISNELKMSAKYLSRYFKEKAGVNISDYISQLRIQKAKELLRDRRGELQIKDISEQVGIYSRMTFLRLFKKYEGITPNEYREMSRKQ